VPSGGRGVAGASAGSWPGVTNRPIRRWRGSRRTRAAMNGRSTQDIRGRGVSRWSTASWWRSTRDRAWTIGCVRCRARVAAAKRPAALRGRGRVGARHQHSRSQRPPFGPTEDRAGAGVAVVPTTVRTEGIRPRTSTPRQRSKILGSSLDGPPLACHQFPHLAAGRRRAWVLGRNGYHDRGDLWLEQRYHRD